MRINLTTSSFPRRRSFEGIKNFARVSKASYEAVVRCIFAKSVEEITNLDCLGKDASAEMRF